MTIAEKETAPRSNLSAAKRALLEQRLQGGFKSVPRSEMIPRHTARETAPLSFAQQRLWFFQQLEPDSPLYNMPMGVLLNGALDASALRRTIRAIVERHEALRTRFEAPDGSPVQVIVRDVAIEVPLLDLSSRGGDPDDAEVREVLHREARRPFDLTRDPLLRALLLRLAPEEHVLLLTMHHIASDGWSWSVLFNELTTLYRDFAAGRPPALAELPIQYADYAVWQRQWLQGEMLEKQLAHWKRQLAGMPEVLALLTDRPRPPVQTFHGGCVSVELPASLGRALTELSRKEGVTLFMTLLAAFQTLLHRYTHQTDIAVGTPIAGRTQRETEALIGFFINTLVLRGDLTGDPTFRELLARVRETTLAAFTNQDLPFEKLVEELRPERSPSHSPLVQVMFVLQNAPTPSWQLPGLSVTPMELDTGTAKFDLTLAVEERTHGLSAAIEYNRDLFEAATISRMLTHWRVLLESIVADSGQRLSELALLDAAERRQVLGEWSATATDYPREKTIPRLFEEQVAQTPDAVAVEFETQVLTYRELNRRANRLAHHLLKLGVGPDTLVGVCLERSLQLPIALLGILKAGGAYVSLDAAYPKERLAHMIEDAQPPVILTTGALATRLPPTGAAQVLRFDGQEFSAVEAAVENDPAVPAGPENLAYVSFTSGSTGRPKGVCVRHRGVVRLVKATNYVRLDAGEALLQLAPIAFDASTFELWGALLNGARLVVFPPQTPTLAELGDAIQRHGITTLWLTAGLFHQMIEHRCESLRGVRQLLAGGDVLAVPQVRKALEQLPGCRLINGYGPTENTTFTCCHRIMPESAQRLSIPIGRPVANTRVLVLDERRQPVPVGVPGELYAGGDGLARGYLRRPELTAEKFVRDPFTPEPGARLYKTGDLVRWLPDGRIEFLGRIDTQVKIRGFRIELDEIETVLGLHPAVRACAVIAPKGEQGERRLVACLVAGALPAPAAAELRRFLADKLPDYMVPAAFVFTEALPLDPNGKVDRRALAAVAAAPAEPRDRTVAARDELERKLVEIWEDILGVRPIGVTDGFFELGGHSLLAVRLLARIEKAFGKKLPLATIFQASTIAELAEAIRGKAGAAANSSLVELRAEGGRPPLFLVHGVGGGMFWGYGNLARHLGGDQPLYAFKSRGLDGREEFATIEEMAAHYVADLRAFQPHGPYFLGGYCFGGNVACEMARQLGEQGEQVALLVLMNCAPTTGGYGRGRLTPVWLAKYLWNLAGLLGNFCRAEPKVRRDFLVWKWRTLQKRLARRSGRRAGAGEFDAGELVDLSAYSHDQRRLWAAHVRALCAHRTQPFDGRVVLFRSRVHQLYCSFDSDYGWREFVRGPMTVEVVPGAHESILEEPHVQALARRLAACLRQIHADFPAGEKP